MIILDSETIPPPDEQLTPWMKEYITEKYPLHSKRLKNPSKIALAEQDEEARYVAERKRIKSLSVDPWFANIVCVVMFTEAQSHGENIKLGRAKKVLVGEEKSILRRFWKTIGQVLEKSPDMDLLTFNGKTFDLPLILNRSAFYKMKPTFDFSDHLRKYSTFPHLDLCELLNDKRGQDYKSLEFFLEYFHIANEKEDFDGSMVYEATLAGETDKVIRHCTNDCRSLFKLYQKLNGVLLKRGRRDLNYARGVY